jgi:hypothetical protein
MPKQAGQHHDSAAENPAAGPASAERRTASSTPDVAIRVATSAAGFAPVASCAASEPIRSALHVRGWLDRFCTETHVPRIPLARWW